MTHWLSNMNPRDASASKKGIFFTDFNPYKIKHLLIYNTFRGFNKTEGLWGFHILCDRNWSCHCCPHLQMKLLWSVLFASNHPDNLLQNKFDLSDHLFCNRLARPDDLFHFRKILSLQIYHDYSIIKLPDCPGGLFDVKEHVAGETGSLETAFRWFLDQRTYFF